MKVIIWVRYFYKIDVLDKNNWYIERNGLSLADYISREVLQMFKVTVIIVQWGGEKNVTSGKGQVETESRTFRNGTPKWGEFED